MKTSLAALLAATCLLSGLAAQKPDFDALDAKLKFKLDDDGRILMSPDPSTGSDEERFTPIVRADFTHLLQHGGVLGWASLIYQGGTDFGSMADGQSILRRLGRAGDVSLIQGIAEPQAGAAGTLLQLMAIRAAQDRGMKQALGAVLKVAEQDGIDPFVRQAAREAAATLRGEGVAPVATQCAPLADVLAGVPDGMDVFFAVEQRRLPQGRALLRWAREAGMAVTRREILQAGGSVSAAQWAGAVMLAEGVGAMPYEVCRRFGNHRFDRTVVALDVPKDMFDPPSVWVRADGLFDIARLRKGLVDLGVPVGGDGREITCSLDGGVKLTVTSSVLQLRFGEMGAARGAEAGAALAKSVAPDDAPLVVHLSAEAELPALPPGFDALGIPRRLALWLPRAAHEPLRLSVTSDGERFARQLEAQAKALPRMLERAVERFENADEFEPLLEALEEMKVECDGATVTASMSLVGVDVRALVGAAIRAGGM